MPLLCAFVSYAHSVAGRECGDTATHVYQDEPLCSAHFSYVSGIHLICASCKLPSYDFARVVQYEHSCSLIDMGADCMHFENDYYCSCAYEYEVQ